jgi:hypothetical protein
MCQRQRRSRVRRLWHLIKKSEWGSSSASFLGGVLLRSGLRLLRSTPRTGDSSEPHGDFRILVDLQRKMGRSGNPGIVSCKPRNSRRCISTFATLQIDGAAPSQNPRCASPDPSSARFGSGTALPQKWRSETPRAVLASQKASRVRTLPGRGLKNSKGYPGVTPPSPKLLGSRERDPKHGSRRSGAGEDGREPPSQEFFTSSVDPLACDTRSALQSTDSPADAAASFPGAKTSRSGTLLTGFRWTPKVLPSRGGCAAVGRSRRDEAWGRPGERAPMNVAPGASSHPKLLTRGPLEAEASFLSRRFSRIVQT